MSEPTIQKLSDGRFACSYTVAGVTTNFTGSTLEEVTAKIARAHASVTDALSRSRKSQVENFQKAQDAVSAANGERIILAWLRNASHEYGGAYYHCAANDSVLLDYLTRNEIKLTPDNLTMAFNTLSEQGALAPVPSQRPEEPQEEPLPPTPKGYPEVNTAAEVRNLGQSLRNWLSDKQHSPQAIAAFKLRIDAILAREDVRRKRIAPGSLGGQQ